MLHVLHSSVQAVSQHTPSTQNPDLHCALSVQATPFTSEASAPASTPSASVPASMPASALPPDDVEPDDDVATVESTPASGVFVLENCER